MLCVFTKEGVVMRATVIHTPVSAEVSVNITLVGSMKYIKDITKFKSEYSNVKLIKTPILHDRFIITDKSILYHLGSSLNSNSLNIL